MKSPALIALSLIFISVLACKTSNKPAANSNGSSSRSSDTADTPNTETGVEKVKPADGTGNVQGKVLFNSKPAENIEVTLCEKFSQFLGGCDGKKFVARTDKDGEYVITNVPPKTYEALTLAYSKATFMSSLRRESPAYLQPSTRWSRTRPCSCRRRIFSRAI